MQFFNVSNVEKGIHRGSYKVILNDSVVIMFGRINRVVVRL